MTMLTPEHAGAKLCPAARTFGADPLTKFCRASDCMCWRWEQVTTAHPAWRSAVQAEAAKIGEKAPFPKASAAVAADLAGHGLIPTRGYCGMGGKP